MYAKRGTGKKEFICETCGKKFIGWAKDTRRFCSDKCQRHSVQTKDKIRLSKIGKAVHTTAYKEKLSIKMKGNTHGFQKGQPSIFRGTARLNIRGKNHGMWKGGSDAPNQRFKSRVEYRLWREAVFARDNWTCQKCGKRQIELHPHHIKNFAIHIELRTSIENGITLCKKCHFLFHKIYGNRNNTRQQLNEFLQDDNR